MEEDYYGYCGSRAAYVPDLTEEPTAIPPHRACCIHYDHMARDMQLNGHVFSIEIGWDEIHAI